MILGILLVNALIVLVSVSESTSPPFSISPSCKPSDYTPVLGKNDCGPLYTRPKDICDTYIRECYCQWGIELKWVGASCTPGHGGCQCGDYCGYTCKDDCRRDPLDRCKWVDGIGCVNKYSGISGPLIICYNDSLAPTSLPSIGPSISPSTFIPSKTPTTSSPSRAPTTSIPSHSPSNSPSQNPSHQPTTSIPSSAPRTTSPSHAPQNPTTTIPSHAPSTTIPSHSPSRTPSTSHPSMFPSMAPTPICNMNHTIAPVSSASTYCDVYPRCAADCGCTGNGTCVIQKPEFCDIGATKKYCCDPGDTYCVDTLEQYDLPYYPICPNGTVCVPDCCSEVLALTCQQVCPPA